MQFWAEMVEIGLLVLLNLIILLSIWWTHKY